MGKQSAIYKIEQAITSKSKHLSLRGMGLSQLPSEIVKLSNLKSLDLGINQFSIIPNEVWQLTSLETLYLSSNNLTSIPDEIVMLKSLVYLDLSENSLDTISSSVGALESLTFLNLNFNKITVLPLEFGNIKTLTAIYLAGNELSTFPVCLLELPNIETLDLSRTGINELPIGLAELSKIRLLKLKNNNLKNPPIEIVSQGTWAILNYLKSLKDSTEVVKIFEAKLIIVGAGRVGKTSLMNQLVNSSFDSNELTTEGIDIKEWTVETDLSENFKINVWDFGGQEIYHATHQFFLTKRSLYLFVWNASSDGDLLSFDYWLNTIKLLSDGSPTIVIMNKMDERIKMLEESSLKKMFPNIAQFHSVSALNGTNIKEVKNGILNVITRLEHVGDTLPKVWIDIRNDLLELDQNYIGSDEYFKICESYSLDKKKAKFLSQYYHDLGSFLHFQENDVLRNIIFLNPDWATNAVYKVIDTKQIQLQFGKFHFDQLSNVWDYLPDDKYMYLLELMKKFEICFRIPKTKDYIIPDLLRVLPDAVDWVCDNNLIFEYRYTFMPVGIITRLIVRVHDLIDNDQYWKNGAILKRENSKAFIVSSPLDRKIRISLTGSNKKSFLEIIRREVEYIHSTLNNPAFDEMVPCLCEKCKKDPFLFIFANLKKADANNIETILCQKSFTPVSIGKLIGNIYRPEKNLENEMLGMLREIQEKFDTKESMLEKANDIVSLKPNLFGMGIDINEIVQQLFGNKRNK